MFEDTQHSVSVADTIVSDVISDLDKPVKAGNKFKDYDETFQTKIVQALIIDKKWAAEIFDLLRPDHFEYPHLTFLCKEYFAYYSKYKVFQSLDIFTSFIKIELQKRDKNDPFKSKTLQFLSVMASGVPTGDLEGVKELVETFLRRQQIADALSESVSLLEKEQYDAIYGIMQKAVASNIRSPDGYDFIKDIDSRFDLVLRNPITTGAPAVDEITEGGLAAGELAVVIAPTGVGKSHWLVNVGASALKKKKNVLHFSFELSAHLTAIRYDSHLNGIDSREVRFYKDIISENYRKMMEADQLGNLKIVKYSPRSTTVVGLKSYIEKQKLKVGFHPDIIIIDYADLMMPTTHADATRMGLQILYEEIRALAEEMEVPIWTASQSNRAGSNSDMVTLENIAESYGKAQTADFICSISQKEEEKSSKTGRFFVAKSRLGPDGQVFDIEIEKSMSIFRFMGIKPPKRSGEDGSEMKNVVQSIRERLDRKRAEEDGMM